MTNSSAPDSSASQSPVPHVAGEERIIAPETLENERQAVDQVIDRLAAKFPTIDRDAIIAQVRSEHEALMSSTVRDYVPVLVEHGAKKKLKKSLKD